jgi:uncharacterized protein YcbX
MSIITVSELNFYPVKSCRGISVHTAKVGPMGIQYDRQWMFINENGIFIAQRGDKKLGTIGVKSMCQIVTKITSDSLVLDAPDMPELSIPLEDGHGVMLNVRVWNSFTFGMDQGEEVARWATEYLSKEVPGKYRMVRMPNSGIRKAKVGEAHLAFADAYPFLILSEASLADLNSRLEEPLPMNRFRPNIVLTGCDAYTEDIMPDFTIGNVNFIGMNCCVRCPITTTNQFTAERGKEPLLTLSKYRKTTEGVIFGRNFNHTGIGLVSVGDELVF